MVLDLERRDAELLREVEGERGQRLPPPVAKRALRVQLAVEAGCYDAAVVEPRGQRVGERTVEQRAESGLVAQRHTRRPEQAGRPVERRRGPPGGGQSVAQRGEVARRASAEAEAA